MASSEEASTESETSAETEGENASKSSVQCLMHFPTGKGEVQLFTEHSWTRFLEFTDVWKAFTKGPQAEIATQFIAKTCATSAGASVATDQPVSMQLLNLMIPENAGHHRSCYSQYTDKSKVKRAVQAQQKEKTEVAETETAGKVPHPPMKTRRLRSAMQTVSKPVARSQHVLPKQCILCRKEKCVTCRVTRKRRQEPLVTCTTLQAERLLQAAEDNNNEELLMHIRGKDCVAIEVRYHHSCYVDYTRYLSKSVGITKGVSDIGYAKSYAEFCTIVKDRIIMKKEIFRLNKLTNMFKDVVQKTEGIDISSYKSASLKVRLIKSFPQLCFLQPHLRSQGEIVYVNDVSTEALVQEKKVLEEAIFSSSNHGTSDTGEFHLPQSIEQTATLRELFVSAQSLKAQVDAVPQHNLPWPPMSTDLTTESAERIVPPELYNFLAWLVGGSTKPQESGRVMVENVELHKRILNIAQDVIYTSSHGRKQMPKHLSLAMTLRHLTGSAQLIGLMNGFGYCSSHSLSLEHDTALALQEMSKGEDALPTCIERDTFTTLVWDNNDFREDTKSGKGTTHNTNGIVIQQCMHSDRGFPSLPKETTSVPLPSLPTSTSTSSTVPTTPHSATPALTVQSTSTQLTTLPTTRQLPYASPSSEPSTSSKTAPSTTKKSRLRTLPPPPANIEHYHGGKSGPKPFARNVELELGQVSTILKYPKQLDLAYSLCKFRCDFSLPNWTTFNQLVSQTEVPPKSKIGYLPIIDASPTEMDTVLTILLRSVQIADQLNLDTVVVVMDQAIYSKAQIIRWSNPTLMQRIVIRLGAFHTTMSFLGCIGKRFRDGGLQDVVIESEIVAPGSINGAMTGSHYNRSMRMHKLMYEALQHLKIEACMQSLPQDGKETVQKLMQKLQDGYRGRNFQEIASCQEFDEVEVFLQEFVSSAQSSTFAYWNSYIEMVEILLLFQRSIREGNWLLHLASVRAMLPWIFAYDHVNYARYLPVYLLEMSDLVNTHEPVYQQFRNGNFTVQRSANAFSQVACDQTIEQTVNRDSKTKGGMVGFTTRKGAVNRWIWSHHQRAAIARECEDMACRSRQSDEPLTPQLSRTKADNTAVMSIVDTVDDMINPFTYGQEDLVHITSGVVASTEVSDDIKLAHEKGDTKFLRFAKERLQSDKGKTFFDAIPKLKLKTFSTMAKTVSTNVKGKNVAVRSERGILARLVVIGKVRKIDLQELFTYNLSPLPMQLSTHEGLPVKTNKASLMRAIEDHCQQPTIEVPRKCVYIIDGMAFIQQLNITKLPGEKSFENLANVIMSRVVSMAKSVDSRSVHFVTDTYPRRSIKGSERKKRAGRGFQIVKVYGQNLPQQWKKFLASGENKEGLIEYLFQVWRTYSGEDLKGVDVYLAHGPYCHMFSAQSSFSEDVSVQDVPSLECNHEEADTRLFLHAAYAARACPDVVICSPDTDVFIIGLSIQPKIDVRMCFHTGVGDRRRTLDLQAISQCLGDSVCSALIGLHCLTGCDSVSAFYGKGKKKAFKLILKNEEHCQPLGQLGEGFEITPQLMQSLEHFVCELYGQKTCFEVNKARHNMFRLACKSEIVMPPNQDSLKKHTHRANYQASVYKQSLIQAQVLPSPLQHGWKIEEDELAIEWSSLPAAPDSVLSLVHCTGSCKKSHCLDSSKCSCLANGLPCTDLCFCKRENCSNGAIQSDDEDDTDSESGE